MAEMPHPRKHHREALLIRRLDDFFIPYRAARLYDAAGAGGGRREHAVGEGEKGV